MRIRTNIFVWVFLATVLPLTALGLGATYYSESTYQREVDRAVMTSLENTSATLVRQLQANQNLILGISRAPAVQAYIPVLEAMRLGELPSDAGIRQRRVNSYFEGFQTILPGVFILRILDSQGNTVAKVSHTKISPAVFESLSGLQYAEQEINNSTFVQALSQLQPDEVSSLSLPQNHRAADVAHTYLLHDAIVPLYKDTEFIGAVVFTTAGESLDRILDRATRLYSGNLMLLELDPDRLTQKGLLLYDTSSDLHIAQMRNTLATLEQPYALQLIDEAENKPEGRLITAENSHVYYRSWFPYPNQLISWLLALRIDGDQVSAPFARIRLGIWVFAAAALAITLLLADLGARRIARPTCDLASRIKAFADGDRQQHVDTNQPIEEIGALAKAFNYLSETLQAAEADRDRAQHMVLQSNKLASIGQMAAGIGHEINNPLNNILSYSKLIARNLEQLPPEMENQSRQQLLNDLQSLREETLRASDIVKGILNFARQVPPTYKRFAIQPWLTNTLTLVHQSAKSRHIKLEVINDYQGELEGDRSQLQQALVNLLLNAIQASDDNATVKLSAHAEGDMLIISVCDEGPGISDEVLDNIYDPFFTTKAEGEGSGLGLSISLGIVERHHGQLEIRNNTKRGVTATLTLPIHEQPEIET